MAYPYWGGVDWQIAVWNKLYRLDFLRDNKIGCSHDVFEDVMFNYKLRLCAKSICLIPNVTLSYLVREASITDVSNKNPNDKMVQTYSDIIHRMGQIASEKENVNGVWDFYISSIRFVFAAVCRKKFTSAQLKMFNTSIQGYMDIIPSCKKLNSNTHRILYVINKVKSDYKTFLWFYKGLETLRMRLR